jgi:hypothetical protein
MPELSPNAAPGLTEILDRGTDFERVGYKAAF